MKRKFEKWKSVIQATVTALMLLLIFTGCSQSANSPSIPNETKPKKIPIKIEDISWSVQEEIVDDERAVVFSYSNNTKYTIGGIEIDFTLKDDVTDEDLKVFDHYKEEYDVEDEDIKDIYITGFSHKFAAPKQTVSGTPCVIDNTYFQVESIKQYEIMQPDKATIVYLDKEKAYTIYYDFKSGNYSWANEDGIEIDQWSDGDLASLISKPNAQVISCTEDSTTFNFTSYGVSKEQFEKYVQACKEKGFILDVSNWETYYNAKNENDYELSIDYYEKDDRMDGCVRAPEKKKTSEPNSKDEKASSTLSKEYSETETSNVSVKNETWKQFLKDYEDWADRYVEFIKKYKENPNNSSLFSEYSKFLTETVEWTNKAQEYEDELRNTEVSSEFLTEYINTVGRILEKIASADA